MISAKNKEYDQAMNLFIKSIHEDHSVANVHNNLANVFMQEKDYVAAIKEYKEAIALDPGNKVSAKGLIRANKVNKGNKN